MNLETVSPCWHNKPYAIVAAPGPSLSADIADKCKGYPTIAVQDAWRLFTWADVLYGCDSKWWKHYNGCMAFNGEKWTTHDTGNNDKSHILDTFRLRAVEGRTGDTFSVDPAHLNYGGNSGFQAVNLAILRGAKRIILVGFDMKGTHFFGSHPKPLRDPTSFETFIAAFNTAAKSLPTGVEIFNATPGSALKCFPLMHISELP